jgi:hypothetical protein
MADDKNKNLIDKILQSGNNAGKTNADEFKAKLNIAAEIIQAKEDKGKTIGKPASGTSILTKEEMDKLYERDDNEHYWHR